MSPNCYVANRRLRLRDDLDEKSLLGIHSGIQTIGELRYSVCVIVAGTQFRKLCRHRAMALLLACFAGQLLAGAQSITPAAPQLSARTGASLSIRAGNRHIANPDSLLPLPTAGIPVGLEPFFDLSTSDIKFSFATLTNILRDKKHEGWVLFAYPDPKTSDPLIGAGFTLSLPAREHVQRDPQNPHQFLEPSSEQLWQAAGFDSTRLQSILNDYQSNLEIWGTRKYRKKIRGGGLRDQMTENEALTLLQIAEVQAIHQRARIVAALIA